LKNNFPNTKKQPQMYKNKRIVKGLTNDKRIISFYLYEGKLATNPIINFLKRESQNVNGTLVDFGCGQKIYKNLFVNVSKYVGVDLYNESADLKEDIKQTSLHEDYADFGLCNQVIEHDAMPEMIIREISRVLKNNGVLLLTAPQMGRLHGEPHDYYRYTKWGLVYLLEKNEFEILSIEAHGGFFRAFGSHLNFLLAEKYFKNKIIRFLIRNSIIRANNFLCPICDRIIKFEKDTLGYSVKARKK